MRTEGGHAALVGLAQQAGGIERGLGGEGLILLAVQPRVDGAKGGAGMRVMPSVGLDTETTETVPLNHAASITDTGVVAIL